MKGIKILVLTPDFPPDIGGIQKVMRDLVNGLKRKGYVVDVVAPYMKGCLEFDASQNYRIYRIPWFKKNSKFFIPFFLIKALALIRQNYDIIVSGHISTAPAGIILKKITGRPLIIFTYAIEVMDKKYMHIILRLLINADRIVVISDFTRNFLNKQGIKNTVKIHPGIDPSMFNNTKKNIDLKRELGLEGKIVLSTIARLDASEQYKGHDTIIKILPSLRKKITNIHYLIVGGGNDIDRLKELAVNYGVQNCVTFTGRIDKYEKIPDYFSISDIFIMASKQIFDGRRVKSEGLGIVFVESQAMGIPVIGGNSGGIPDVVIHNKTGLLVNPEDPDDVEKKILMLIKNSSLRKKLINNARKRALSEFTENAFVRKFDNLIRSLLKQY